MVYGIKQYITHRFIRLVNCKQLLLPTLDHDMGHLVLQQYASKG